MLSKEKVIETNQIKKPRYINNFNCIIEEIFNFKKLTTPGINHIKK